MGINNDDDDVNLIREVIRFIIIIVALFCIFYRFSHVYVGRAVEKVDNNKLHMR